MEEDYFANYLAIMRRYIKTLRLVNLGYNYRFVLDNLPDNYYIYADEVGRSLRKEYEKLSDYDWYNKINYYKKRQDEFNVEYEDESYEYCNKLVEKYNEDKVKYEYEVKKLRDECENINPDGDINREECYQKFNVLLQTFKQDEKYYKQNQSYMHTLIEIQQQIERWLKVTPIRKNADLITVLNETTELTKEVSISCLSIVPASKQKVFDELSKYVHEKDHETLHELIFNETPPINRIPITCLIKNFGLIFSKAEAVPDYRANQLSKQLSDLFIQLDKGELRPFTSGYLVKLLRIKDRRKKP